MSPRPRRWNAFLALVSLLSALSSPVVAVRAASAKGRSSPGVTSPVTVPRYIAPPTGRFSDSDIAEVTSQSQLNQLVAPSTQRFEIVPPAHPNLMPTGPLPGYQIVRLGKGHYNRLCLAGTVGGVKGLMMLDTGANNTALSDATYRGLLLNASSQLPAGLPRALSVNGTRTPLAEAPDFYVGKSNLGAVPVSLIPRQYLLDPSTLDGKGRLYDGLMGENILRHYNAMIDCGRLVLYLDVNPARKLNLSSSFMRNGWTRVAMSDIGNDFTVPCVLNGHPFRLIVDTASPFTSLDRNLLAAVQIGSRDLPASGGLIGRQPERVGLVELDHLQIGDYPVTGVHMISTTQSLAAFGGPNDRSAGGPIVGLLGGDILARDNAVIDIGSKALYLKRSGGKAFQSR